MIEPYPIIEAPLEALLYTCFFGIVHAAILGAGLVLALPLCFWGWRQYLVFARGFAVFSVLLLLTAAVLNAVWSCTIWGRVYYSTDYVVDFNPFYPISQTWIETPFGNMKGQIYPGFGMLHVRAAWFLFALATWTGAIYLYSRTRRLWNKRSIEPSPPPYSSPAAGSESGEA